MCSNSYYPQFIEHSFRRLSLLIHQQDESNNTERATPKTSSHPQSSDSDLNPPMERKTNIEPISRTHRTYMRPPKHRGTTSKPHHHPSSSSSPQCSEQSETSLNQSINSSYSPPKHHHHRQSHILPVHVPYERTPYDMRFEKERQNDVREKYDIPPPFQRKWLRQPRYVPQERPTIGQVNQSKDQ